MTTPISRKRRIGPIASIAATAVATVLLAHLGYGTRHPSLGLGALIVGVVVLAFLATATVITPRGPLPVRAAGGSADERERRLFGRALAHAGAAMAIASAVGIVAGLDANGPFVAGAILFIGVVAGAVSACIQATLAARGQ